MENRKPVPCQKAEDACRTVKVGNGTFLVKRHFGTIPVEDILRPRILAEHRRLMLEKARKP